MHPDHIVNFSAFIFTCRNKGTYLFQLEFYRYVLPALTELSVSLLARRWIIPYLKVLHFYNALFWANIRSDHTLKTQGRTQIGRKTQHNRPSHIVLKGTPGTSQSIQEE